MLGIIRWPLNHCSFKDENKPRVVYCLIEGVEVKVVVWKIGWVEEGWYYMYLQHSIIITGNFNAHFKLLTHNRYSVLNGHFVRQIHPSSLLNLTNFSQDLIFSYTRKWSFHVTKICSFDSLINNVNTFTKI